MVDLSAIFSASAPTCAAQTDVVGLVTAIAPYVVPFLGMGLFEYLQNRQKSKRERVLEDREYDRDFIQRLLDDRAQQIWHLEERNRQLEAECDLCQSDRESLKVELAKVESHLEQTQLVLSALHRQFGDQISLSFYSKHNLPNPNPPEQ